MKLTDWESQFELKISEIASSDDLHFSASGIFIDGPVESNLVMKAYALLKKDFDLPPLRIHLHKQIPFGAGLGGGSSDGAFMLQMLNKTFNLGITAEKLIEYAAVLGSDSLNSYSAGKL